MTNYGESNLREEGFITLPVGGASSIQVGEDTAQSLALWWKQRGWGAKRETWGQALPTGAPSAIYFAQIGAVLESSITASPPRMPPVEDKDLNSQAFVGDCPHHRKT